MLILGQNIVSTGGWQLVSSTAIRSNIHFAESYAPIKTTGARAIVVVGVTSAAVLASNLTDNAGNTYALYTQPPSPLPGVHIHFFVSQTDPLLTRVDHTFRLQPAVGGNLTPAFVMAFRNLNFPNSQLAYVNRGSIGEQGNIVADWNDMLQIVVWAPRRVQVSIASIDSPLAFRGPSGPLIAALSYGGQVYYFGPLTQYTVPWGPMQPPGIIETGAADAGSGAWITLRPS